MKLLFVLIILITTNIHAQVYRVNNSHSFEVKTENLLPVFVRRVIDGDTIVVYIGNPTHGFNYYERVRLIGVDTPETVHPNTDVMYFGTEAAAFTKQYLENETVYLAFDRDLRDVYGRLLAYVYLSDGVCFNAILISEGFGFAYTRFPFMFLEEFKTYENNARNQRKGLWRYNTGGIHVLQ